MVDQRLATAFGLWFAVTQNTERTDMDHKKYCIFSGVLFALVALAHFFRIVCSVSVQVDGYELPMFVSWVGFFIPAGLAFWAFRLSRT